MRDTYVGMPYEEWRASQEAKGFKGRWRSPTEDSQRERQFAWIAEEGMCGYKESSGAIQRQNNW